ncbi:MAG: helix-turn-helix domain-containing protein [Verrucomicrobia bacterium]|jgi:DNA-binding transcriptional ArsR family regulator|nr:helix-turn-helix domain-containing protein [Verrucomicrobiota bacterium]MBT7065174.1 helix-turn-helix domain-containing protein [Verrucomicrobiota bacterium]MBT7699383.1 helix-turn-helix domain-containing protein [Verrucomicrobiota bacterium]
MPKDETSPYEALERIFHEPNRLAIMSALCAADEGLPFTGLRDACGLTDGNLSRHLKALDAAGVLRIKKVFVDAKPRTTVALSKKGLRRFSEYLDALNDVLAAAQAAMPVETTPAAMPLGRRARA